MIVLLSLVKAEDYSSKTERVNVVSSQVSVLTLIVYRQISVPPARLWPSLSIQGVGNLVSYSRASATF
jgi:hypothetical protein